MIIIAAALLACSESSQGQADSVKKEPAGKTGEELSSGLPRMLDLGSIHCIPCKKMAPILDSLEIAYEGKAEIIFIDVRQDKESARKYGIAMIPTQIFFDANGNEVYRHIGFFPADSITAHLEQLGASL